MENKDFDKLFKHKFGHLAGESYREERWAELSGRMDIHDRWRRRRKLFTIWPLFVLMATGNVFWWHQWKQLDRQLQHTASPRETTVLYDTIVHRTIVCDTIYQYYTHKKNGNNTDRPWNSPIVAEKNGERPNAFENTFRLVNELGKTPAPETSDDMTSQEVFRPDPNLTNPAPIAPGHTISHQVPLPDSLLQKDTTLYTAEKPGVDSLYEELLHTQPTVKKARRAPLTFGHPRVNATAGWANPLLSHKRSGALFGVGIGADVELTRQIRLAADVQYWHGKLKADEIGELTGLEIPDPGYDYKLRYWETYRIPVVSYDMQVKYYFNTHGRWTPWIGLGSQWSTTLPFEIEFDYENQTSHYEVFLPAQTRSVTRWQGLLGAFGLERQLNEHFSFSASAFLLQHPGKNAGLLGKQFGLKSRLYYRF